MAIKIASFSARSVYGYMDFDFQFRSNPTIITGPNGRGKTTALRLMQALLTPTLRDLLTIRFSEASVVLSQGARVVFVSAKKTKETLYVSASTEERRLEIPMAALDEMESEQDPRRASEAARFLRLKYADHPVFKAITDLESPLFLGLDRTHGETPDRAVNHVHHGSYDSWINTKSARMPVRGGLAAGLVQMQILVRDAYRRVRNLKDQQSERLRRKLLLTGFRYEEVTSFNIMDFSAEDYSESRLLEQKGEIIAALNAVGIGYDDAEKEINPFFDRVIKLSRRFEAAKGDWNKIGESGVALEILLNQANLQRLRELVGTVREFNEKSENLLQRFHAFVKCLNRFFRDSGKHVEIDPVGAIRVYRPDKTEVPIEALSSGERQLLVMFGHVFFSSFGNRSNSFVIDEPEISLHLRWQEMLLEEMLQSSSRAQIIVATHSPEIVGDFIDNCITV